MLAVKAVLVLALLSAACHHTTNSGPAEPRRETRLKVQNQNFLDMNVFVLGAGQRIRLGTVPGLSTQVFTIPDYIVRSAPQLQFEVHPIGGRSDPRTETLAVHAGDVINLTIPP